MTARHDDIVCRSLYMGQFIPGMWIGNLQSVKFVLDHAEGASDNTRDTTTWTIISVLESDQLLDYVKYLILQRPDKVQKHYLWKLPDRSCADFLSDKLVEAIAHMDESFQHSNRNNSNSHHQCLVHCAMGISRSAAVCAAWLMHQFPSRYDSLANAMAVLRCVRPGVQPNMGLTAALLSIQTTRGDIRAAMERSSRDETMCGVGRV
jgi:protein-tyrosine phosphatase